MTEHPLDAATRDMNEALDLAGPPGLRRICGHCRGAMRGHASRGDVWLCHPDEGLDCYRLVTVYEHETPCFQCASVHYGEDVAIAEEETVKLSEMRTWEEVKADMGPLPPHECENCGLNLSIPANSIEGVCRAGYCTTVLCRDCGREWASYGPVGCDCQSRDPKLRRIRAMYRRRRR